MSRKNNNRDWIDNWDEDHALSVERLEDDAKAHYVAWVDLLGARSWMAGSIRRAAEIIGIIHLAGIRAADANGVRAYPVIDGVYLIGESKGKGFRAATRSVMRDLALTFLHRSPNERFLVRGGIAYGRVLHGESIANLHAELKDAANYTKCLAVGVAIGQAYKSEGSASPFGYHVDMTARSTASATDSPYVSSFFRWWAASSTRETAIARAFGIELDKHFEYLKTRFREIEYPLDRLNEHRAIAKEYFQVPEEAGM